MTIALISLTIIILAAGFITMRVAHGVCEASVAKWFILSGTAALCIGLILLNFSLAYLDIKIEIPHISFGL